MLRNLKGGGHNVTVWASDRAPHKRIAKLVGSELVCSPDESKKGKEGETDRTVAPAVFLRCPAPSRAAALPSCPRPWDSCTLAVRAASDLS